MFCNYTSSGESSGDGNMESILEALGEQEDKLPVMPVEAEENKQARRQR